MLLFSRSYNAIEAQWRILTMTDGQITDVLDMFFRRLDGSGGVNAGQVGGGHARDGQQDDHSCFQQDHFVRCTMMVTNLGVWYRVRTDTDNRKNRRSRWTRTRLGTSRQQHTKRLTAINCYT